jgi:hypothetical protein
MPADIREWSLLATLTGERVTVTIGQDTVFSADGAVHKAGIMSALMLQSPSNRGRPLSRFALKSLCIFALVAVVGCEEPEIKKYTALKDKTQPDTTRLAKYTLPPGWTRLAQPKELSVATFQVGAGDKAVLITVSRFPGSAGGLMANIVRWRGKVGLPKATEDQIRKELLTLVVDGEKTPYVDLANPAKDKDDKEFDRILGVVAERGPVSWFFKMQGPPALVGEQKAAFEDFVKSVKFGGVGVSDG